MKPNTVQERSKKVTSGGVCRNAGRKVLEEIARAKAVLRAEWFHALKTQQDVLRLALNEAEALAWQTRYPHLVFPVLATEKVQAVAAWNRQQQKLWWNNPTVKQMNAQ